MKKFIIVTLLATLVFGCTVLETYKGDPNADGITELANPVKNSGVRYYRGDNMNTANDPDTLYGSELAIFIDSVQVGIWDRENEVFVPAGGITTSKSDPSGAPATGQPLAHINTTTGQIWKWNGSSWIEYSATSGVSDGDKGDITVSGSGTNWTVDNDVITAPKIANDAVGASEISATTVTPGSYTNTNLTVDQDGRVTLASNGLIDSTRLTQDSIMVYYQNGSEVGRDTIGSGSGGGATRRRLSLEPYRHPKY